MITGYLGTDLLHDLLQNYGLDKWVFANDALQIPMLSSYTTMFNVGNYIVPKDGTGVDKVLTSLPQEIFGMSLTDYVNNMIAGYIPSIPQLVADFGD